MTSLSRKRYIASHGWRRYIIWSKRRICVSILTVPRSPITTHSCLCLFSWIISHHSRSGQYKPNITIAFRKFSKWWIVKGNCQIVCHFTEHKSEDLLRMTVWGSLYCEKLIQRATSLLDIGREGESPTQRMWTWS